MHLKRLILCFLILSTVKTSMGTFSVIQWIKGIFEKSAENSTEPQVDENKTNTVEEANDADIVVKDTEKKDSKRSEKETEFWQANEIPSTCNEDAILLPLAHLKITSPEKIIELLTSPSLEYTCERINRTINQVNDGIAACPKFPENHLYRKLNDGLEYFSSKTCSDVSDDEKKLVDSKNGLIRHWECYSNLRDDLSDCEGPPDWFEKRNRSAACQFYNDVIDCNYIKTAMLCGKEAAKLIRDFSDSILRQVLTFRCKISHLTPYVEVSMLSGSTSHRMHEDIFFGFFISLMLISYF